MVWREYFQSYDRQQEYAKMILKTDYQPDPICVNCVINHTLKKHLQWGVKCTPIRAGMLDVTPTKPEELVALSKLSAYYFAKYLIGVQPREFQKEIIQCTQQRKVLRIQRRSGKSHAMQMYMLWFQFSNQNMDVRVIAPREVHVRELFDKMNSMIRESDVLSQSVIKNGPRNGTMYKKNPMEFSLTNGSTIRGITTGDDEGTSARSQSADLMVLDEMDFISEDQFAAIYPIIATSTDTQLIQSSTPSGQRSQFYQWCNDPVYKELHKTYQDVEIYDQDTDQEFQRNMSKEQYEREVLALFTIEEAGVFPHQHIDKALEDYQFDQMPPPPGIYTFGVDWNESMQGVHIQIIRYEQFHSKYRVSNVVIVPSSEFTQIVQINKIIELYEYYKPRKIVMDEGFGLTQIQQLKHWGVESGNDDFLMQLETMPFGSNIDVFDQILGSYQKVSQKQFLVQNQKRFIENGRLILPRSEDTKIGLIGQMREYQIESIGDNGTPRYSKGYVHTLEQMMMQLYGMYLIKDELDNTGIQPVTNVITQSRDQFIRSGHTSGQIRKERGVSNHQQLISQLYGRR